MVAVDSAGSDPGLSAARPRGPDQMAERDYPHGTGTHAPAPAVEPAGLLTTQDIAAIADATARKVLDLVADPGRTFGLVDARELAKELAVSLDYVYAHAVELGAMRLGSGPKARIRFDLDRAREALEARQRRATTRRRK
jgi:hypothetical protein